MKGRVSSFTGEKASLKMSDQMKTTHYLLFMYILAFLFLGTKIFTLGDKKNPVTECKAFLWKIEH